MLASIGLGIVAAAWAAQLAAVLRRTRSIKPMFVGLYAIGVLLLVVDGFQSELTTLAYLNLITLVFAALTFGLLIRKQR